MAPTRPPKPKRLFRSRDRMLHRITYRIRESLELADILSVTVTETREFLQTDRVKIYQFAEDGSGCVVAESLRPNRLPSLQGLHFPAGDIPLEMRELFVKARQRSIVDVPAQQILLSRLERPQTTGDITWDDLQTVETEVLLQRPVDPCHVEYLSAMGVRSSLVVPILHQQKLWGLLVSHHARSRTFTQSELQMVQLLADQVSIAIAQSELLQQARQRAAQEAFINQVTALLHSELPIAIMLQRVIEYIASTLDAAGSRLYLIPANPDAKPEVYRYGVQPRESSGLLEHSEFWRRYQRELLSSSGVLLPDTLPMPSETVAAPAGVIQDLHQADGSAQAWFVDTPIRSLLVLPLQYGNQFLGYLTLFRNAIDTDTLWAGRVDADRRQERVRLSFEAWREVKANQVHPWSLTDQLWIRDLGAHLTMSIMQHRLYQREHEQRLLVEMRNQELNQARRMAEEANRLKSDFLSSTSHELRTPLASILNYLKLLQNGLYDNETEQREFINIAHHSAETLVHILNDVLDLARIEAGRMPVEMEEISLPLMLREEQRLFEAESRRKGIPLHVDCQIDHVLADPVKLRQVLTNLIANAFKFTESGEIRIQAIPISEQTTELLSSLEVPLLSELRAMPLVEISIHDTGIGVDPSKRDILFEPFVQADGSIKRRYGGTGLGLTVCRRLVELMNGYIWLDSPGVGQGTTVKFLLCGLGDPKASTSGKSK